MKKKTTITAFVLIIVLLASIASVFGILSLGKMKEFSFTTVYGTVVNIYGGGLYRYNAIDQVYQAIPHDMVTLLLAVPSLLISLPLARKASVKGTFFLTGTVGYLFISYFMYTFIAMYNRFFLVYVLLTSLCFFTLLLLILEWRDVDVRRYFSLSYPNKFIGTFLMTATTLTALLWLKEPFLTLFTGSIPVSLLEQGTTLPVQAIDLSFFLPIIFTMGYMLRKGRPMGYVGGIIAAIGLMFMMTALVSKGISLSLAGFTDALPLIFFMGIVDVFAIVCTVLTFKHIQRKVSLTGGNHGN